ncbi:MAG: ankyrin repeat domain-containing protein, partial [Candidatus Berkiella sp.]
MNTAYQNSILSKEEGEALINAAIHNKPNEIQKLINLGVNLNYRAQDGYTALNNAVLLNHEKIANMLLSQPSVDVNIPNNYGLAPAYFAHKYNRLPMLDSIIKHPTFDLEFNLVIVNDLEKYEYKNYLHSINTSSLPFLDAYQQAKLFAMKYEFNECLTFKHVDNHHFHCFEMKGYANRLGAIGMADSFGNFYDIIVSNSHLPSWAQSAFVSVNEALEFCATIFEPSVYYQRYQLGELVIIPSGWDRHSIVFVVCDDKLYRCNRGDMSDGVHGIEEFVITKPDKFTVNVFDHMLQASGTPDYLQNQIIDILGLQKIGEVVNPTQIMGNCVWTSLEAGLEASLLSNFLNSGVENSEAHLLAKQSFSVWEEFDLSYTLKTAIDNVDVLNYYEI